MPARYRILRPLSLPLRFRFSLSLARWFLLLLAPWFYQWAALGQALAPRAAKRRKVVDLRAAAGS